MGGDNILHFSTEDEEIADLFWSIGLKRNSALVLTLMIKDVDFTSRDIERMIDLRQPEVSIAITDLMKRGWVHIVLQITQNKGRPIKVYHVSRSLDEILDELKESIIETYEQKCEEIEQVRRLMHDKMAL
jgi:predicted transcriptional regulator